MSFCLNFNPLKRSLLILCVILSRTVVPCSHSRRPATDCLQSFVTYSNLYLRSFSAEKTTFLIPLLRKMNDLLLKSISHKAFARLGAFRSGKRALRGRVNRLATFFMNETQSLPLNLQNINQNLWIGGKYWISDWWRVVQTKFAVQKEEMSVKSESLRNCINVKHTRQRFRKTPTINFCLSTNWHLPDAIVDHSVSWWISIQVNYNVINWRKLFSGCSLECGW